MITNQNNCWCELLKHFELHNYNPLISIATNQNNVSTMSGNTLSSISITLGPLGQLTKMIIDYSRAVFFIVFIIY